MSGTKGQRGAWARLRLPLMIVLAIVFVTLVTFPKGGSAPQPALLSEAPEIEPSGGWMNLPPGATRPELEGRVTLVWFFRPSSIASLRSRAMVERLSARFTGRGLAVIGVWSPRRNGSDADLMRELLAPLVLTREGIKFPVAMDRSRDAWSAYGVEAWPSFVVVDQNNEVVARAMGEGVESRLAEVIDRSLQDVERAASVDLPLPVAPARQGLWYPSGIAVVAPSERAPDGLLAVSETGNDRVVLASFPDEQGASRVIRVIGGGAGFADGNATAARFRDPDGIAIDVQRNEVFVCDTGNHAVRACGIPSGLVRTVVGNGKPGYDFVGGQAGEDQALDSPWDVAVDDDSLLVAMAGVGQVWRIDPQTGLAAPIAGRGGEGVVDGSLDFSAFTWPAGIVSGNGTGSAFVIDADGGGVRSLDTSADRVKTLTSFAGVASGIAFDPRGRLLVSEASRGMLLDVDPTTGTRSIVAEGLILPRGVEVSGGWEFVVESGRHRVLMRPSGSRDEWTVVRFDGLD